MIKFVPAGTDPDGPSGMVTPPQVFAGRPDAYLDMDDLEYLEISITDSDLLMVLEKK